MKALLCVSMLWAALLPAQTFQREAIYGSAYAVGWQAAPRFDKGYLIYLHQPSRLQVFRPDTQLAYEYHVPCPEKSSKCSATNAAVSRNGILAVGVGYLSDAGYTSGVRFLDPEGKEIRFVETGRYVPFQLVFDNKDNLWLLGWERDEVLNDRSSDKPWDVLRKYSPEGKLMGSYLPTTLWNSKHGPFLGGRGYWTMYAAEDRVGALLNDSSEAIPEWVEWDLNGVLLSRTSLPETREKFRRAFSGNGRLYGEFDRRDDPSALDLRVLDTKTGEWTPVRSNLPGDEKAFLLGADGRQLVYRRNYSGNLHLVWAEPDHSITPAPSSRAQGE